MQDEWTHEHQTNWEIYCHLEIYMETAQQVACVVQETHLLQLRRNMIALIFNISSETSFFYLSYGILRLSGLH